MPQLDVFGYDANTVKQLDDAYWSAQPLPVQALRNMDPSTGLLYAQAMELAGQGYFIDNVIMVWKINDPYYAMLQRQSDGIVEYKDALGIQERKVSLDPKDYPPVPVVSPAAGPLVDKIIGFGPFYFPTLLATQSSIPAGQNVTENGETFTAQYIPVGKIDSSPNTQLILRWKKVS